MKMAKPSPADIKAAEELHQVLQLIDARFGGPFSIPETGQSPAELLHEGEDAFDSDNLTHLQTLYNHLARLLRTAPNFYGRVIGGMLWVIMNEANEILDPASDVIDLHPRFQQMADRVTKLETQATDEKRATLAFNAVIQYMLGDGSREDPMQFLHCWNEGNFNVLRTDWPDAPADIYYADPLADHEAIAASQEATTNG